MEVPANSDHEEATMNTGDVLATAMIQDPEFAAAREKLINKPLYDYVCSNPLKDPYIEAFAKILTQYPENEHDATLTFMVALSEANTAMAKFIKSNPQQPTPGSDQGLVIQDNNHVRRGRGALPFKPVRRK